MHFYIIDRYSCFLCGLSSYMCNNCSITFCFLWVGGPLDVGYRSVKVFDYGWVEYFGGQGLYWVLFNLGRVNQWFQYNSLSVFLGFFVMWVVVLLFIIIYLNSLYLVWHWRCQWGIVPLSIYKSVLYFYSESVMFSLNYTNRSVNWF